MKKGYICRKRRYKTPYGEVDLVMTQNTTLIFVEVKKRKTFHKALISITDRQKARIKDAALYFLQECPKDFSSFSMRFDCVLVDDMNRTKYIKNIL